MTNAQQQSFHIGIFIFNDVEVLDFAGPYEVFTTAARVHQKLIGQHDRYFKVNAIAVDQNTVRARAGLHVVPDATFRDQANWDVLIIPGGEVTEEFKCIKTIDWIRETAQHSTITASVCTGAFLLAKAGLLDGLTVTTHWEDCTDLQTMFPQLTVNGEERWIDHGTIVTSAGISAGIDMALHLVERLAGRDLAIQTARQMQYHSDGFAS